MSSYAENKDILSWLQQGYNKKREYFELDESEAAAKEPVKVKF